MSERPWQELPPIHIAPDSAIWADTTKPVEFVVEAGMSMPWIMKGPGVTLTTRSLDHANRAAVRKAAEYNERYPGMATAVTVEI